MYRMRRTSSQDCSFKYVCLGKYMSLDLSLQNVHMRRTASQDCSFKYVYPERELSLDRSLLNVHSRRSTSQEQSGLLLTECTFAKDNVSGLFFQVCIFRQVPVFGLILTECTYAKDSVAGLLFQVCRKMWYEQRRRNSTHDLKTDPNRATHHVVGPLLCYSVSGLLFQVCIFGKATVSGLLLTECTFTKDSVSGILWTARY